MWRQPGTAAAPWRSILCICSQLIVTFNSATMRVFVTGFDCFAECSENPTKELVTQLASHAGDSIQELLNADMCLPRCSQLLALCNASCRFCPQASGPPAPPTSSALPLCSKFRPRRCGIGLTTSTPPPALSCSQQAMSQSLW